MQHCTDRIVHTMAFGTPAVEHWLEGPDIGFQIKNTSKLTTIFESLSIILVSPSIFIDNDITE